MRLILAVAAVLLFTGPAEAARLWSNGFELNSATSAMECPSTSGSFAVQTTTKRSGGSAGRIQTLVSATRRACDQHFIAANNDGPFYFRAYFRFDTVASGTTSILSLSNSSSATTVWINLTTSNTLTLADEDGTLAGSCAVSVGSATWTRVELFYDRNGGVSDDLTLRVNGTDCVTDLNRALAAGIFSYNLGGNLRAEAITGGDWYIDDVAINNTAAGGINTTWPGDGAIVHLYPNGEGDADTLTAVTGCASTAVASQCVDETPTPDDATSYVALTDTTSVLWVDVQDSSTPSIPAGSVIKFVSVGGRLCIGNNGAACSATAGNWFPSIKSQASGTVTDGTSTAWATAAYNTHDDTAPRMYKLTSYADPQAGGSWTTTLLDSMQIGAKSTDGNPDSQISSIWALVEWTTPPAGNMKSLPLTGVGRR